MSIDPRQVNRVRQQREAHGWTQAELALRAGISRTAISAIEGQRLVPSVAAALAVAQALDQTVEQLFGAASTDRPEPTWAWQPLEGTTHHWQAEVGGQTICFPAGAMPMWTPPADDLGSSASPQETLVMACCDPAAGLLAQHYAASTGQRLLVLPRSSRQALELLRDGLVHLAGLHLSTQDEPELNAQVARQTLAASCQLLHVARWQEGIVSQPSAKLRSVRAATRSKLTWVGREPGSGARSCLDRLLPAHAPPRRLARHHRAVAEAVQAGWADVGVCVQLVGAEAGLDFLPVQQETYDLCLRTDWADDPRIQRLIHLVRSAAFRKLFGSLPGYDTSDAGTVSHVP